MPKKETERQKEKERDLNICICLYLTIKNTLGDIIFEKKIIALDKIVIFGNYIITLKMSLILLIYLYLLNNNSPMYSKEDRRKGGKIYH